MLAAIVNTFTNCFKIPELKSRILYTLMVLAICRLEAVVRIPGLNGSALSAFFESKTNTAAGSSMLGMYSLFTGGALEHCAVGALGIMPYISATIIIQLLTAVIPTLSKLAREEGGRTKIIQYGRYLTVLLCLGQGLVMAIGWENPEKLFQGWNPATRLVLYSDAYIWFYRLQTLLMLTTGTMLLMWLGEQITERGIGNGVSLVITIGILARLPQAAVALWDMFVGGGGMEAKFNLGHGIALVLLLAGVIAGVIAITQAQRKVPVQYAQRAVGRKVYSGGTSFMPLRVNYSGVMPIIFAQAILMFPQKIFLFLGQSLNVKFFGEIARALAEGALLYMILYALMGSKSLLQLFKLPAYPCPGFWGADKFNAGFFKGFLNGVQCFEIA